MSLTPMACMETHLGRWSGAASRKRNPQHVGIVRKALCFALSKLKPSGDVMQTNPFKICRNCNCHNGMKKRKCANCGGNRFDLATDEQMKAETARMSHVNALLACLAG